MPTDKTIDALCKDPTRAVRLAAFLLTLADAEWTAWELTFLAGIVERGEALPLSYRQSEKLLELEDRAVLLTKILGLSILGLIRECWALRFALEPEDEAWIDTLYRKGAKALRRGAAGHLLACLRQTDPDLIEGYVPLVGPTAAA
jgi:hypothetical protein